MIEPIRSFRLVTIADTSADKPLSLDRSQSARSSLCYETFPDSRDDALSVYFETVAVADALLA